MSVAMRFPGSLGIHSSPRVSLYCICLLPLTSKHPSKIIITACCWHWLDILTVSLTSVPQEVYATPQCLLSATQSTVKVITRLSYPFFFMARFCQLLLWLSLFWYSCVRLSQPLRYSTICSVFCIFIYHITTPGTVVTHIPLPHGISERTYCFTAIVVSQKRSQEKTELYCFVFRTLVAGMDGDALFQHFPIDNRYVPPHLGSMPSYVCRPCSSDGWFSCTVL
jgi:hypothetical protein